MLNDQVVVVTGGTGSFGQRFTEMVLTRYRPRKLIIFSRDELKQFQMQEQFGEDKYPCIRYFIGDVRDRDRLYRAFDDVDYVVHAAALKQVPAAEYNPIEAVREPVSTSPRPMITVAATQRPRHRPVAMARPSETVPSRVKYEPAVPTLLICRAHPALTNVDQTSGQVAPRSRSPANSATLSRAAPTAPATSA